jgi:hypothetical protein
MELPGYDPFYKLPDAERLYRTERGSTYAHFSDQTSQRNRSGEKHSDKTTGLQDRSLKTVYMEPRALNAIGTWLQDESTSTRLKPVLDAEGRQTGRAQVQIVEPHTYQPTKLENGKFVKTGPPVTYEAGRIVAEVPYEKKPVKGYHPVEIFKSDSPKGNKGTGIHFGSKITEIMQRTGGGGGGGGGGSLMQPDPKQLGGTKIGPRMAVGGAVNMPENYSTGRWRLI